MITINNETVADWYDIRLLQDEIDRLREQIIELEELVRKFSKKKRKKNKK